jgi:hypothetical protein
MNTKCKKCGRPLRDPMSIARGMGVKCAGLVGGGKRFRASQRPSSGVAYPAVGDNQASMVPFSLVEDRLDQASKVFRQFPSELVNLVLAPSTSGSIAAQIKSYSRRQKPNRINGARLLKQLRSMCIEMRLTFWPGLFMNREPIPCMPYGEEDWKIGENGRVVSKEELVAYLRRYGIISQEQLPPAV